MHGEYILSEDDKTPVEVNDLLTWARWMETGNRRVAKDKIGEVEISTVFLGLDHSFGSGAPVLWETMVFGGKLDQEQDRYCSYEEALKGHASMLAKVLHAQEAL